MKKIPTQRIISSLLILLPILAGCSKTNSSAPTLAPEKIPPAMNEVFKQCSGETKEMAFACVSACQSQDVTTAFSKLQKLNQDKNLTPEQRAVTAQAMAATFQQLRTASEKGNPAAQALLHQYLSTR